MLRLSNILHRFSSEKEKGTKRKSRPLSKDRGRPSKISSKSPSLTAISTEKKSALGKICFICYGIPAKERLDDLSYDGDDDDLSYDDEDDRSDDLSYYDDDDLSSYDDDEEEDDESIVDHSLFLLDLDAESGSDAAYVPRNPNLCFDRCKLGVFGCCVLQSTLYLFGTETTDVFSYKLSSVPFVPSSSSSPPPELTADQLTRAPCMNFPKSDPLACLTPDGKKMLVLSSVFYLCTKKKGDFELFDPDGQGKWTPLPDVLPLLHRCWKKKRGRLGIPPEQYPIASITPLESYAFIDNGPVLLITTKVGNFTLDTERPGGVWSERKESHFPRTGRGTYMLVRDRLRLTDWSAWVDGSGTDPNRSLSYPGLLKGELDDYYIDGRGITWLSPNRFCVVRSRVEGTTLRPLLIVDVCDIDSENNDDNLVGRTDEEVPGVKVKKRFKFVLGPMLGPIFAPLGLFSVP